MNAAGAKAATGVAGGASSVAAPSRPRQRAKRGRQDVSGRNRTVGGMRGEAAVERESERVGDEIDGDAGGEMGVERIDARRGERRREPQRARRGEGSGRKRAVPLSDDDGSADVIAVSLMTTKMPDGKTLDSGNRWVVTATREGEQWKVSNLLQVI